MARVFRVESSKNHTHTHTQTHRLNARRKFRACDAARIDHCVMFLPCMSAHEGRVPEGCSSWVLHVDTGGAVQRPWSRDTPPLCCNADGCFCRRQWLAGAARPVRSSGCADKAARCHARRGGGRPRWEDLGVCGPHARSVRLGLRQLPLFHAASRERVSGPGIQLRSRCMDGLRRGQEAARCLRGLDEKLHWRRLAPFEEEPRAGDHLWVLALRWKGVVYEHR